MYENLYGTYSPVEDRMGFSTKGIFKCSRATEQISVIVSIAVGIAVYALFYTIWGEQFIYIFNMHNRPDHWLFFAIAFFFVCIIIFIVELIVIHRLLRGVDYHYTANMNVFSFYSVKAHVRKTDIHYNDVVAVNYEERKLFGLIKRGYTVTIITHSLGTITLYYIFNKSIKVHIPANTPFYIIEQRMIIQKEKQSSLSGGVGQL